MQTVSSLLKPVADFGKTRASIVGGLAGGAVGGFLAYRSVSSDEVLVRYETQQVPRPETSPVDPGKVFSRMGIEVVAENVKHESASIPSYQKTMGYLAYAAEARPDVDPFTWGTFYQSVRSHVATDEEARKVLLVLGTYLERNPDVSPGQAFYEFHVALRRAEGEGGGPEQALSSLSSRRGILPEDYLETRMQLRQEHSSPLWSLGTVGATLAGISAGALLGAGLGVLTISVLNLLEK
ncbi:MAG: hypothetical protein HYU64_02080 [Armatimonadetes bacterium]|nr:hypothetical protein [Armatimonadota bacterium]